MIASPLRGPVTAGLCASLVIAVSACSGGNHHTLDGESALQVDEATAQAAPGRGSAPKADIVAPLLDLNGQPDPASYGLDWGIDLIKRTRDSSADHLPSATPVALLDTMARAEDAGDVATFAKALRVDGEGEELWAVCMLLPQANRRIVDLAVARARQKLGAGSDLEGMLLTAKVKGLLSQASFRERPVPGFYLPNGAFMMKVMRTEAGWRVTPASQAERLAIPAQNLPSMLAFSAYLASVYRSMDQPSSALQAVLAQASAASATVRGLVAQTCGAGLRATACPQCGQNTLNAGHCATCGLDLTASR